MRASWRAPSRWRPRASGGPFRTRRWAPSSRAGDGRWIPGPAARRLAHALRGISDAVLVGAGTVRADDPRLTCRLPGGHHPVRIVLVGRALRLPGRRGRVPFAALVRHLGARGLTSLLVEGGGTVAAEALRARAVDRLVLFVAPAILGGDAVAAVGPLGRARVGDAVRITDLALARIGPDIVLEGRVP